jgi:aspartate/methionine/tyrosine aminotransferase
VGTKEFVASAAWFLRLRSPERDTVLAPAVAYPTYALSAQLAGCRVVAIPEGPGGGLDLSVVSDDDAGRAVMLWVNSPANPTGSLTDLGAAALWGRAHGVPVFSDECYAEFTWALWPPPTILHHGSDGVVAVHSLSKRSNMAGVRVGFYAGDPDLVRYLSLVRQHAGLMVPGPVQAAATVALDDDVHVVAQRARYRNRLDRLSAVLGSVGLDATVPAGTFYLWVPAPAWAVTTGRREGRDGAWVLAEALADAGGMLVSPGEFYGEAGAGHVRIAVVQPDDRIELVARRLARSTDARLTDR